MIHPGASSHLPLFLLFLLLLVVAGEPDHAGDAWKQKQQLAYVGEYPHLKTSLLIPLLIPMLIPMLLCTTFFFLRAQCHIVILDPCYSINFTEKYSIQLTQHTLDKATNFTIFACRSVPTSKDLLVLVQSACHL